MVWPRETIVIRQGVVAKHARDVSMHVHGGETQIPICLYIYVYNYRDVRAAAESALLRPATRFVTSNYSYTSSVTAMMECLRILEDPIAI